MTTFTQDQWIILALVFILGVLIGVFLTAGGRRKWKTRYRDETERREALEREHAQRHREWEEREKEWRERDSLRGAAIKSGRDPADDRPL
jgi:C4-dicarboxylate-specific signal transduction histidine kinase